MLRYLFLRGVNGQINKPVKAPVETRTGPGSVRQTLLQVLKVTGAASRGAAAALLRVNPGLLLRHSGGLPHIIISL